MNLGAEPKKIAILGGLALVGGYVFYANVLSGPEQEKPKPAAPGMSVTQAMSADKSPAAAPPNIRRAKAPVRGAASQEFKPSLKLAPGEKPNYATVDPELRKDLLAKVQSV